ncbi:aminopeptidase N [Solemya velum gill symbiont]|uniref:Aminopeptidase N n=3 Tax=Solemya velum gill symbiont TaxID=2340 RepID=A0A0B0H7I3_SOVGS|nr:aminopeptidase N [Solemya velum gill symbiont]KHF24627.1 aminopeptidase N [Solemya velum gill symbiont]OOY34071.1 aminopeptidase N [Solemya velum gill symbiont]OOY36693.1 aminopeptidase N [Solemya velum gill symbiont]OOY40539.1 aminopeptidase N [Solemya velum gill symbiont]OOY46179.1 aminopeptidase N [Solemya velum gill symbiont]
MKDASSRAIHLSDYQPPAYLVDQVDLTFDLRNKGTKVKARLELRRNGEHNDPLLLDGEQLNTLSVAIDGNKLAESDFIMTSTQLRIDNVPDVFILETEVEIAPESNTALEGLYRSNDLFCTQCEAEGFRRITWYPDRPDVMALFRTSIEAERDMFPVLLSNGNPVSEEQLDNGRHRITWEDPFPKPSYLFALVAGNLALLEDRFTTMSGREVTLRIYSEPENIDKCDYAMESLKKAMRWDEEVYGREYDLDIFMVVAVNDFNMGAMENKGLNIFNAKLLLARPDTATDMDYQGIEAVVAHEYFHNWTGNRITCRDWFQLSLKEGLTVFRDQEFSADMGSRDVKRIEDVRMLRSHQFAEDASPMAHPVRPDSYIEINNFYTLTVYEKGAEVVRMQALLLGDDYRRATDLYFERYDGQAVTTDDFVSCMESVSGRDLGQFRRWYSQAGTPQLHVSGEYDADKGKYSLKVRQELLTISGQKESLPMLIPLAVGLLDSEGNEMPLRLEGAEAEPHTTIMIEVTEAQQEFLFTGISHEPVPSLLRGFSAPVKLHFDYSQEQLLFLMAHDSDGFVRWDAAQTLHQQLLLEKISNPDATLPTAYIDAIRKVLLECDDLALATELLALPSESYLGDQMEIVDVDAIHAARESVRFEIAEALDEELAGKCSELASDDAYEPVHEQIAARSLKNHALSLLAMTGTDEVRELVESQYMAQQNMTDVMAALSITVQRGWQPLSRRLLEDFERCWSDMPLVMDKWFGVQASVPATATVEAVTALMSHPAFTLTNPNRVRALVGSFVMNNPVAFHREDGAGYRLLADLVIELNDKNPQVAARLVRHMSRWRRYDEIRSALMKEQLEHIAAIPAISRDVSEIVNRSLA